MAKEILVAMPNLTEHHRQLLSVGAQKQGYAIHICEDFGTAALHLPNAEIILGISTFLTKNAPKLKWFCAMTAGVEQYLAPDAFASEGALLSNSSGAYGVSIAEHIVMVALDMMRRQADYANIVKAKGWQQFLPMRSLCGSRITIMGTGNIGQEAAIRLKAFSPQSLTGVNRSGKNLNGLFDAVITQDELVSTLPQTDLLIIALPETGSTKGMMNEEKLRLLPKGAYLINVGRGSSLDQSALERLLREGYLGGAALDVVEQEPPDPHSTMWDCPNLLITPHISGNILLPCTADKIVELFLEDLENFCMGRPLKRGISRGKDY